MRRGEEGTAFQAEAGACAKAVWWQVALPVWLRPGEERRQRAKLASASYEHWEAAGEFQAEGDVIVFFGGPWLLGRGQIGGARTGMRRAGSLVAVDQGRGGAGDGKKRIDLTDEQGAKMTGHPKPRERQGVPAECRFVFCEAGC